MQDNRISSKPAKCLFSAPFSFMPEIQKDFQKVIPTVFQEIWEKEELKHDGGVTAWVMNPGQHFLINDKIIDFFPNLTVLVTPSTGRNHIDLDVCARRNVAVYSLLDDRDSVNTITASSEFTFLLLLNTLRRLDIAMREVSRGRWRNRENVLRGHELRGKKMGLVGLGRIGRRVAGYCKAFEAEVAYYDPYVEDAEFRKSSLMELFSQCDVVCVCCRLTSETTGMINGTLLARLKRDACLINTSRGEVINEDDLISVLMVRPDLRIALDVLSDEVMGGHLRSPLLKMHKRGQIVITPHIAGATIESQAKAARIALDLLTKHLELRQIY